MAKKPMKKAAKKPTTARKSKPGKLAATAQVN